MGGVTRETALGRASPGNTRKVGDVFNTVLAIVTSAVICAIVIGPLRGALKKHPWAFYVAALVIVFVFTYFDIAGVNTHDIRFLTLMIQKGYLSSFFLAIVMFIGVADSKSSFRKKLQPIRGELSILSFIFIIGHLVKYLPSYLPRLGKLFSLRTNVAVSLILAFALTIIFLLLTITSFRAIHARMNPKSWKRLQRLSYLMVALLIAHIAAVLGISALKSGWASPAGLSVIVYAVIVLAYTVLRIRRAVIDHRAVKTESRLTAEQA
jgi:DMSO/TMAO reductase YedYZ heme-binding membrane subunit